MNALTLPRTDLYADDEHVVAEWRESPGDRLRAEFAIIDVKDDEDVERDEEAVFVSLARVGETIDEDPAATIRDVPGGVLWAVEQFAADPVANAENQPQDGDGPDGIGRGVA